MDIHDIQELDRMERDIKRMTDEWNALSQDIAQRESEIVVLKGKDKAFERTIRQICGERDTLKKKISILPR